MKKRLLALFFSFCMVLVAFNSTTTFAEETTVAETTTTTDENVMATGLIMSFTLSASASTKKLSINATTYGTDTMAKIGFKDIKIQRSSNRTSGWTDEKTIADQIATNSIYHYLSQYSVSVAGGYYYRVVLTHYAKETGWLFPGSQSITNYSVAVWVPAS